VGQIAGMAIGLVAIRLLFGRTAVEPGAGPHPS
jgi:hypothetical protein